MIMRGDACYIQPAIFMLIEVRGSKAVISQQVGLGVNTAGSAPYQVRTKPVPCPYKGTFIRRRYGVGRGLTRGWYGVGVLQALIFVKLFPKREEIR